MKPFSLTTVLDHRKRLLDIARGRFAEAQAAYAQARERLERCRAERADLIERLAALQRAGIDIDTHIRFSNRIDLLLTQAQRLQHELQKKHELVLRERTHLLQKSKEHRVLEKLKDRQDSDWRHFLDKKEAKMLDEIAVLSRNR